MRKSKMRKLSREVNKMEIFTSSTKKVIALYERLNNDINDNPKYQITIIPPEDSVRVYTCVTYTIEESITSYIKNCNY